MKNPALINDELRRSKGLTGTKEKYNSKFELHRTDFKYNKDYLRALSSQKRWEEKKKLNKFIAEQVNGTIFTGGHEEPDGFVTYDHGGIL